VTTSRHPTVIIGLGSAGAEIARSYSGYVQGKRALGILTEIVTLEAEACARLGDATDVLAFDGASEADTYKAWHDRVANAEGPITAIIANAVRSVTSAETLLKVDKVKVPVDAQADIVLVTALGDTVGSASIMPVLGFLNFLYSGPFLGQYPSVEMLLLWPDLFAESKDDKRAFARSAATLQEISRASRVPGDVFGCDLAFGAPATWLLSGTNSEGTSVGLLSDLLPMVTRAIAARCAGNMSMGSYLASAENEDGGAWGSFGLCELSADTDGAMLAISGGLVATWASTRAEDPERRFQRAQLAVDVERFLRETGAASPETLLSRSSDGTPLFTPFSFKARTDADRDPGQFEAELRTAVEDYQSSEWLRLQSELASRRESVLSDLTGAADRYVAAALDDPGRSAEYALSFLQTALGEESEYLDGEAFETPLNLGSVASQARSYFEEAMGLTSRRDEADAIEEDLATKERLIQDKREQLKLLSVAARLAASTQPVPGAPITAAEPAIELNEDSETGPSDGESDLLGKSQALDPREQQVRDDNPGDQVDAESLGQDIEDLKKEIGVLRARRKEVQASVRSMTLAVKDKMKRDAARDEVLTKREAESAKLAEALAESNAALRAAQSDYEAVSGRAQAAMRTFVIRALVLLAVSALLCAGVYYLMFLNPLSWAFFSPVYGWVVVLGGYVAWVIGATIRMSKLRRQLEEAEARVSDRGAHKRSLMNGLYKLAVDMFAFRFDWAMKSLITDLVADLQAGLRARIKVMAAFRHDIDALAERATKEWDEFEFSVKVFSRPLLHRDAILSLIGRREQGLVAERDRLAAEYPYSVAYKEFLSAGNLDVVAGHVNDYCETAYSFVRELTVETLAKGMAEENAGDLEELLAQAVRASKPFLMLYGDGVDSQVAEHTYLGVRGGDASALYAHVLDLGENMLGDFHKPQVFDTADAQHATFYRFLLGLSLTQVGSCLYAMEQLRKMDDPSEFYADIAARGESLGSAEQVNRDNLWEDLVLARAVGILPLDRQSAVESEGHTFGSLTEFEGHLRTYGGRAPRLSLHAAVAESSPGSVDSILAAIANEEAFDASEIEFLRRSADALRGW